MKKIAVAAVALPILILAFSLPALAVMSPVAHDSLVREADVIVHGFVIEAVSRRAADPNNFETAVRVLVSENLKGQSPESVVFTVPGGSSGGDFYFVSDWPNFELGQEVVLFMDVARQLLVGQIQGKVTIANGVVSEMMIDSSDYLASVRNLVAGLPPTVALDATFAPVSAFEGYIRRLQIKYKYSYNGMKWSGHSVRVSIHENCPDTTTERAAVIASMTTWNNAGANFRFVDAGANSATQPNLNGKNEIMWGSGNPGQAIAYTSIWGYSDTQIAECDLLYLTDYTWSSDGNPGYNEMDVQNIGTHELGHFLSLLDLYNDSDQDKTMYGYAGPGETYKRSLTQDDINGIIHIYGEDPNPDDDATDDAADDDADDDATDDATDDDWMDDDGADDADDDIGSGICSNLMDKIYTNCGYTLIDHNGNAMSVSDAYDLCTQDNGPWACINDCAQSGDVHSCSDFSACLQATCEVKAAAPDDAATLDNSGKSNSDSTGSACCGI